jgi:cytochrome P450
MTTTLAPGSNSDSFQRLIDLDPEMLAHPEVAIAELARQSPLQWVDSLQAYVVAGYLAIREVLASPARFPSGAGSPLGPLFEERAAAQIAELMAEDPQFAADWNDPRAEWVHLQSLLDADPPLHTNQRRLVNSLFTPKTVRDLEPSMYGRADALIDAVVGRTEVDLVTSVAKPFPLQVIAAQMGLDLDHLDDFARWSYAFVAPIGNAHLTSADLRTIARARIEFRDLIVGEMEERRRSPRADLLTDFALATEEDGSRLSDGDALRYMQQFISAGHETTTNMISCGMRLLADDPELAERISGDPKAIEAFVEEALRLSSPVQGLYRTVAEDTTIGGVGIPAGSWLLVLYSSANRDQSVFGCPHAADLNRPNLRSHVSFGHGIHRCIGAPLARAEGRVIFERLLERCYPWRPSRGTGSTVWLRSFLLPGAAQYWVTLTAR